MLLSQKRIFRSICFIVHSSYHRPTFSNKMFNSIWMSSHRMWHQIRRAFKLRKRHFPNRMLWSTPRSICFRLTSARNLIQTFSRSQTSIFGATMRLNSLPKSNSLSSLWSEENSTRAFPKTGKNGVKIPMLCRGSLQHSDMISLSDKVCSTPFQKDQDLTLGSIATLARNTK